jgi:hypothetical protein
MKKSKDKDPLEPLRKLGEKYTDDAWQDKAVLHQYVQALRPEMNARLFGGEFDEKDKLENKHKCHACGSIVFLWAGSCRICSVCAEPDK